ncbi:MAG: hypothetical protein MJ180_06360 [Candidatus Gastranaerophilales bacterium]|nr:hypothetical protein [Candidatus Gastranaerophilales bacterium]
MKISALTTVNNKNLNFSSGKVHLFSDFDKTYMPESHSDFTKNQHSHFVDSIRGYFADFRDFLSKTKDDLKFTITTGRTYAEFETMAEISRERKFGMPLPDTLICKNGSDEYIKLGTDAHFYEGGYFPFDYKQPNPAKEAEIKKLTGWDGRKIKEKLTALFKAHDLQVIEAGSEHSRKDYGWRSMFSSNNLDIDNPYEWKVAFRNDGNCKIFFVLPKDMTSMPERKDVLRHINDEMQKFFSDNSMKVHSYFNQKENACGGRPYFVMEPLVDDTLKLHVSDIEDSGLTKLFDTKKAVREAVKTNDLVVAAGDSINDRMMLNPIHYMLDEMKKRNIDTKFINANSPKSLISVLEKHPELYEIYRKLPFMAVIEKHLKDEKLTEPTKLDDLIHYFGEGKYKKIVVVENGQLKDGIKEAIKLYSEYNREFKNSLGNSLIKEIFGNTKSSLSGFSKSIMTCVALLGFVAGYKCVYDNTAKQQVVSKENIIRIK